VTSFYGRRSTLWELFSDNEAIRSRGERKKINIPVQGGGADISKLAMLAARRVLRRRGWWGEPVRILMNQHDSLIFEVRDDLDMAAVIRLLEPAVMLTGLPELQAFPPMEVDWEVGLTWGDISTFTPEKETDSGGSMQVRFADGGFSVELSDADGAQQFDDWDEMTVVARFGKLSALAELLGSDYLFKHGDIEPIEYKQRVERLMPVVQPQAKAA
jgi:hypothetical protein